MLLEDWLQLNCKVSGVTKIMHNICVFGTGNLIAPLIS